MSIPAPRTSPHVVTERRGAVAVVRLDRADKKNAMTSAMYAAVADAWTAAEADPTVAVHLWLGLPGAFSAGNDLEDFLVAARDGGLSGEVIEFLHRLATLDKPLVVGVDGLAIGVGTTALFHADWVVASDRSLFRTPFLDLGLVPEAASSLLGPARMGAAAAFDLLALGTAFDASRALATGIVTRVVAADAVEPLAAATAEALAAEPRGALAAARRMLRDVPGLGRADILARIDAEAAEFATRLRSDEAKAAFAAFFARKK